MTNWKTQKLKKLAQTFSFLDNEKDAQNFLRDLCSLDELAELSNRWEAVKMIDAKVPYRAISEKTGMSTATVTRIAKWLNHGEGGYKKALKNNPS